MAHRKPNTTHDSANSGHQRALRLAPAARRGLRVPEAELAAGAVQQVVERFHQREVRAQPAAIQTAVAVGHGQKRRHQQQCRAGWRAARCDSAACGGGDLAAQEGVDAQTPAQAQKPELGFGQVEAQQVQRRRQQEQREEAELQRAAAALQALPAAQACRRVGLLQAQARGVRRHRRPRRAPPRPARRAVSASSVSASTMAARQASVQRQAGWPPAARPSPAGACWRSLRGRGRSGARRACGQLHQALGQRRRAAGFGLARWRAPPRASG